ncbi:MFS transporter [Cupriavidus consociatus]|uniref:MFS transporter n=1 Tax=Cupriavidus consociatus TaxID=2821357 RepID=UPI001AE48790|nr:MULTISPECIES: MFS transporter [unclassified Cupriavidus]MBP0624030.1 MFS transporter [Cupriavidus sp. LEh25]MDK2660740.1 MFS transporter [Cupriavidus sp. LEh21]
MTPAKPPRLLLLTIGALTLIDFLQNGMVAFSAAPIMGEIGASPEEYSTVAAAYASVAVLMIALQRWMVERMGWRRYVQAALCAAALGAVLCANAGSYPAFLVGRMVMALGCAGMVNASRLAVNLIPPGPARFTGIKALVTGVCTGLAISPWLASAIVTADHWPLIFWLAAAAALALLPATRVLPAATVASAQRSDAHLLRLAALATGSFLVLYVLQRSYYDFYADRLWLACGAVAGVSALLAFIWSESRSDRPLLKLRSLVEPRYLSGLTLFTFCYVTLGANGYLLPIMLQRSLGHSWSTAGQFYALGLAAGVATWATMSRLLPRWPSPRKYFVGGFLALAVSAWLMSRLPPAPDLWGHVLPALALYGVFIMTLIPVTAMQTFNGVAHDESVFSNAQQTKNMLGQMGTALGVTIATVGQQWLTTLHYSTLHGAVNVGSPQFQETIARYTAALSASMEPARASELAMVQIAQVLAQQSALLANLDHFRALAALSALAIMVSLVQKVIR